MAIIAWALRLEAGSMRTVKPVVNTVDTGLLLDEKEAAQFLGVSLSYLRKARSEGSPGGRTPAPPFVRIGRRCLYRRADLEQWVKSLASQRVI